MPRRNIKLLAVFITLFTWATIVFANSAGPPLGNTGAPGEGTCNNCHSSFGLNSGGGSIVIAGLPQQYEPGRRYNLTVTVSQSNRNRWGFQMTAITDDGAGTGTFIITDAAQTQMLTSSIGGRQRAYVQHTSAGTQRGRTGSAMFRVDWTAPSSDVGNITFYASGNAANGDGTLIGDNAYTTMMRLTAAPPPTPRPTLAAILPASGPASGGTEVVITGTNFVNGLTVQIGARQATVSSVSATQIRAVTMPNNPGPADVVVTNPDGQRATLAGVFTFVGDPPQSGSLQLLTPNGGEVLSAGGLPFTINWRQMAGSGATQILELSTDGGATFPMMIASDLTPDRTSFSYAVPAGINTSRARIRIGVIENGATTFDMSDADFRIAPAPTITTIKPTVTSSIKLKITGTMFQTGAVVEVNGTAATTTFRSGTSLVAKKISGSLAGQAIRVRVRNPDGTISSEMTITP